MPFLLTARAENLMHGRIDMADTIRRLQAYEAAGADVLYAPGLRNSRRGAPGGERGEAAGQRGDRLARSCHHSGTVQEAGAKRISVGGALSRLALATFVGAARAMQEHGSFAWMRDMMPTGELRRMFGATPAR